MRIYQLNLIWF